MTISINKLLWITSLVLTVLATESPKPELLATSPSAVSTVSAAIPTGPIPAGPEARQAGPGSSPSLSSPGSSSVYPYNLNSLYASSGFESVPPSPSGGPSASSIMSFLRSPQGGRRSSLTSRLRNLMNSIFFRETGSPYMTSASNNFYSYRQPPPFGFSSLASSSGLPSGYGSSPNFLTAAASGYRPVVFPNYPGSSGSGPSGPSAGGPPGSSWSNYKQWSSGPSGTSSSGSGLTSSLGSPGGTQYAWSTNSGSSGSSGGSPYSPSLVSSYNSPSGASPSSSYTSSSGSIPSYQASASNTYPSSAPASSYGSSSSYPASGSPYQRSSNSNFKPVSSSGPISTSSSVSSSSSASQPSNTYKN